ncbi:hypothetical protein BKP37_05725 [Anaerobacillus alkalilacustris]|uniref:NfeD-like C-terminal domain-containing protein n=1 Tax=Anaerobacillus alkalilacustris TaxID=393763 RepID=A0A1S2LW24_9BACI|nr:NfeD family protein [Anaerobacillus alkalilacustris]OIJ16728.1 hypothetical protein BKP37_05725 [Anaerobacillus alkalilacustris]
MEILNLSIIGFFVVFLGTLFLFGELLVKAKGIFAIIGIGIMATYFSFHITPGSGIGLWVALLYIFGISLIVFDGKFVSDGTLAFLGILLMIIGIALPTPNIIYGFLAAMALLLGTGASILFIKVFPSRNLWTKLTLNDQLTGELGYNSLNQSYKNLVGKRGLTKTAFRPIGTIEVEGSFYSAISDSQWLAPNTAIIVVSVDGTRIVVKKIDGKSKNE